MTTEGVPVDTPDRVRFRIKSGPEEFRIEGNTPIATFIVRPYDDESRRVLGPENMVTVRGAAARRVALEGVGDVVCSAIANSDDDLVFDTCLVIPQGTLMRVDDALPLFEDTNEVGASRIVGLLKLLEAENVSAFYWPRNQTVEESDETGTRRYETGPSYLSIEAALRAPVRVRLTATLRQEIQEAIAVEEELLQSEGDDSAYFALELQRLKAQIKLLDKLEARGILTVEANGFGHGPALSLATHGLPVKVSL